MQWKRSTQVPYPLHATAISKTTFHEAEIAMKTENQINNNSFLLNEFEPIKNIESTQSSLASNAKTAARSYSVVIEKEIYSSSQDGMGGNDEWNSIRSIENVNTIKDDDRNNVSSALKAMDDQGFSIAATAVSLMVLFLSLFSKLQKAQMDMAASQLNLVLIDMRKQIEELKKEQKTQFGKDIAMASLEAASSVVQFVSSAVTTTQLKGKLSEQTRIGDEMKLAAAGPSAEAQIAQTKTKIPQASLAADAENLPSANRTDVKRVTAKAESDIAASEAQVADVKKAVPPKSINTLREESTQIRSETEYINNRQQLFSATSGILKAGSPAVQGALGNAATEHQIEAKKADNAKENNNALYRQYMAVADGMRDAIRGTIALLQDMQSQDPNNSTASSKRMS